MANKNNYPNYTPENIPYLISLKTKLIYAKEFTPHKVAYYEEQIKQWEAHTPILNKLKYTRFQILGYTRTNILQWYFIDLETTMHNGGNRAIIGAPYRTEKELLADVERFATERGYNY